MSHSTHYRSFRGRFLQVIWPNRQCQSTEENQLVFQIRLESCELCCWLWTLYHTTQHRAVLIIFPLNLQTVTITRMLYSGREGYTVQFRTNAVIPVLATVLHTDTRCSFITVNRPGQYWLLVTDILHTVHSNKRVQHDADITRCDWTQCRVYALAALANVTAGKGRRGQAGWRDCRSC